MDGAVDVLSLPVVTCYALVTISSLEPVHMFGVGVVVGFFMLSITFEYRVVIVAVLHRIFWLFCVLCVVHNLFFVAIIVADVTITPPLLTASAVIVA